jgi:hypothetical protein
MHGMRVGNQWCSELQSSLSKAVRVVTAHLTSILRALAMPLSLPGVKSALLPKRTAGRENRPIVFRSSGNGGGPKLEVRSSSTSRDIVLRRFPWFATRRWSQRVWSSWGGREGKGKEKREGKGGRGCPKTISSPRLPWWWLVGPRCSSRYETKAAQS